MSTTRPYSPGDHGPESGEVPVVAGTRVRRLSLSGASGIVPLARDFTREALHAWGWLPAATADRRAAAEDVLLVVSELVTNACLHAEGPDGIILYFGDSPANKVLRIEVADRGRASRAAHPAPGGTTRRARHVHRPTPLPGLGSCPHPGSHGQGRVGGGRRPRVAAFRAFFGARRIDFDPACSLSSLGKVPGVP